MLPTGFEAMVFKSISNSLPGSVATWAFSGRAHHVTQDHPVYISRNLSSSALCCLSPPSGLPLASGPRLVLVVQRVLGHATASMTMDLYGHLVDDNLWEAARAIGASWGHLSRPNSKTRTRTMRERTKMPGESR